MKLNKITSTGLAKFSNVVFAERISSEDYVPEPNKIITDVSTNKDFEYITYRLKNLTIYENDVIFCHSDYIDTLFYHLRKVKNLKNIKIITNQTDSLISKKIFLKKPRCVSTWYSVNVGFDHKQLIPVPLGLASRFSKKNLTEDYFKEVVNKNDFIKEDINLYLNFQVNTNFVERSNLYKIFTGHDWVTHDFPDNDNNKYHQSLKEATFVLCPWGNGVDTHRLWEALYSGSIPVTKQHVTYKSVKDLPILFVDDYEDITYELLEQFLKNLDINKFNIEKLDLNYWIDEINTISIDSNEKFISNENSYISFYFRLKADLIKSVRSFIKKFKTISRKVKNRLKV
tara:strand:- start:1432 stop:2457 length:1026 start_codon:yes stop_codon:yes gene_type:complete